MTTERIAEIEEVLARATNGGQEWYVIDQVTRGYRVHGISYKNDDGEGDWVVPELGSVDEDDLKLACEAGPIIKELLEDRAALVRLFPKCLDCSKTSTRMWQADLPQHRDQHFCDDHPKYWSADELATLVSAPWADLVREVKTLADAPHASKSTS